MGGSFQITVPTLVLVIPPLLIILAVWFWLWRKVTDEAVRRLFPGFHEPFDEDDELDSELSEYRRRRSCGGRRRHEPTSSSAHDEQQHDW